MVGFDHLAICPTCLKRKVAHPNRNSWLYEERVGKISTRFSLKPWTRFVKEGAFDNSLSAQSEDFCLLSLKDFSNCEAHSSNLRFPLSANWQHRWLSSLSFMIILGALQEVAMANCPLSPSSLSSTHWQCQTRYSMYYDSRIKSSSSSSAPSPPSPS